MYTVVYLEEVVKKDIPALSKAIKNTIKKAIETRLMTDPIKFGKPLQYSLKGHRRLRIGDYRVIYKIQGNTVNIIAIKHRKDVYRDLE